MKKFICYLKNIFVAATGKSNCYLCGAKPNTWYSLIAHNQDGIKRIGLVKTDNKGRIIPMVFKEDGWTMYSTPQQDYPK